MKTEVIKTPSAEVIIKKCHVCGQVMESSEEIKKCVRCNKSFLPTNYFTKVHAKNSEEFKHLFATSDEINEDEIIKGIQVLW